MLSLGVQVFFIDDETFDAIHNADGECAMQSIFNGLVSENSKRNINVKPLR